MEHLVSVEKAMFVLVKDLRKTIKKRVKKLFPKQKDDPKIPKKNEVYELFE